MSPLQEIIVKKRNTSSKATAFVTTTFTALATSLTLLAAATAQADTPKLVNEDGSKLSQLCIEAASSDGSLFKLAKSFDVSPRELNYIACNGEPILSFVRSQRKSKHLVEATNYSFNHGDSSMETELCIAAVTEPEKFAALKPEFLEKADTVGDKILCNNRPLETFVKRYSNPALSASL